MRAMKAPGGFHPAHQGLHHRRLGGQLTELRADLRHVDGPIRLRHAPADTSQEAHLDHESDLRLVILKDVRGRVMPLGSCRIDVAIDEDTLPRDFHVIEVHHRIVLVVMRREWVIELTASLGLIGLA